MGLSDLTQELIKGLTLMEDPADFVDRVPIGRDGPHRSADSDELDTPSGGLMEVDEGMSTSRACH